MRAGRGADDIGTRPSDPEITVEIFDFGRPAERDAAIDAIYRLNPFLPAFGSGILWMYRQWPRRSIPKGSRAGDLGRARTRRRVPAGELARLVGAAQNTLSTHVSIHANEGLVQSERRSRSILYRANLDRLREVVLFPLKDCCGSWMRLITIPNQSSVAKAFMEFDDAN